VKVFVDATRDIRLIRRIRRDMAQARPAARRDPRPVPLDRAADAPGVRRAEQALRRRDRARGGHNPVAIEMIVAKIVATLAAGTA
jgi:hypothetical protein